MGMDAFVPLCQIFIVISTSFKHHTNILVPRLSANHTHAAVVCIFSVVKIESKSVVGKKWRFSKFFHWRTQQKIYQKNMCDHKKAQIFIVSSTSFKHHNDHTKFWDLLSQDTFIPIYKLWIHDFSTHWEDNNRQLVSRSRHRRLDTPGVSEHTAEIIVTVNACAQPFVIFLKFPEC